MSPLSQSEFTVKSTKHFLSKVKEMELHESYQMISFGVKSLFTNVPLSDTIDILFRQIYIDKEINANLTKKELKEDILLCTKDVNFTYNNLMYKQVDGEAMGSPLGPILAGIFMIELERILIPTLNCHLNN